jgi:hypothetical protein
MMITRIFFAVATATMFALHTINVPAQDASETRAIDVRSNKAIQAFVAETMELAIEYEKNGDTEKARLMYRQNQVLGKLST